jgi:hypothetical protein
MTNYTKLIWLKIKEASTQIFIFHCEAQLHVRLTSSLNQIQVNKDELSICVRYRGRDAIRTTTISQHFDCDQVNSLAWRRLPSILEDGTSLDDWPAGTVLHGLVRSTRRRGGL